jgi:hypothetical protein
MQTCERVVTPSAQRVEGASWFTVPGPTASFLQTAPRHLLQDNRETAPAIQTDPSWFTQVGPTTSFVQSR